MLKIKGIIGIFLVAVVFNLILIQPVFAVTGTVTGSRVRVRKEPKADGEIITNVVKDTKIEIIKLSGDWYEVKVNGNTGYISKDYLKADEELTPAATAEENTEPMENITSEDEQEVQGLIENAQNGETTEQPAEETAVTENLATPTNTERTLVKDSAVYIIPLISSRKCDNLSTGKQVTTLETLNGWIKINYDEKTGWIRVSNLSEETAAVPTSTPPVEETATSEPEKPAEPEKTETAAETKVGYINGGTVNVRKEANTSSAIIAQLDKGDKIDIISTNNGWHEVKADGQTGYVSAALVVNRREDLTTSRSGDTLDRTQAVTSNEDAAEVNVPVTASGKGQEAVDYAMTFLQTKYVSGGNGPNSFDCSGFTCYVYKKFGVSLARSTGGQATAGTEVAKSDLKPRRLSCI